MTFTRGKFAKYALFVNLCVILIAITPLIEKRTQFVITSTLARLLLHTTSFLVTPYKPENVEYFMKAPELIKNNGYEAEIHHVNNSQYYRLELHRIPNHLKSKESKEKKSPVFLHHGVFCSSADFVVNKPHEALAYLLADEGYDVWLGNVRGNSYSRFNYKMSSDDPKFWDFSLDEIIQDDMPVIVDYILQITNQSQLYYIGHSMGATLALGLLSSKPEFNNKVKALFALGPGIFMTDSRGMVYFFIKQFMHDFFDNGGTMPEDSGLGYISASLLHSPLSFLGSTVLQYSTGDKQGALNESLLPLYINQLPSGISKRILRHFGQMGRSGNFSKYDWGEEVNNRIYNQDTPPNYDLSHVTTPTHVFYAANDILTPPSGSHKLAALLPNCKGLHQVGTPNCGHMYHLWGTDISYHRNLIEILLSY